MENSFFVEVACRQIDCAGERICGDSFLCRRVSGGARTIVVLSDGMGHGVKANILSTLTSTMLAGFVSRYEDITRIAELILKTLPVCSVRKISYSTFTMLDIDNRTGEVQAVEYDNPRMMLLRDDGPVALEGEEMVFRDREGRTQKFLRSRFTARRGDRLVLVSDGVTQSGQRAGRYRFGWGADNLCQTVCYLTVFNRDITSADLAAQILSKASLNDDGRPSDDMSAVVIHFREPRRLLMASCPPAFPEEYPALATLVSEFRGTKAVCGYPVAEVLAAQLGLPVERDEFSSDPSVPPVWRIPSFELVTEGIVTLNRMLELLERPGTLSEGNDAVHRFCRLLLRHDEITFLIGTKRNVNAGGLPDEFELRRNMLRRLAALMESRYGKQVFIRYV